MHVIQHAKESAFKLHMYTQLIYTRKCTHTRMPACMHLRMHARTCACTHVCMHVLIPEPIVLCNIAYIPTVRIVTYNTMSGN